MITVVIVDYNSEALLRRCLQSLAAMSRSDLRYVIIDNGGTLDATALEADFPDLTLLNPGRNLGFAGGCNVGIQKAVSGGADYCLLLNPDTIADDDFIEPLLSLMTRENQIGVACPKVCEAEARGIAHGGGGINWWTGRAYLIPSDETKTGEEFVNVSFATGAAMMLRISALRDVGPMDEGYFLYFEDVEFSQKFLRAGWKVVHVPYPEIRHAASSVTGFQSERYVYYFARNRMRFMRRCANLHHRLVFYFFNTFIRMPGALIVFGVMRCNPKLAIAFLRGFRDGLLGRSGKAPI